MICVGATDHADAPAGFSNVGRTSVDLMAAGVGVIGSAPALDTILSEDFEDIGDWTTGGTNDSWGLSTTRFAGATSVADSPAGDYLPDTDSFIRTTAPFDLEGRLGCRGDSRLRIDSERAFDVVLVQASTQPDTGYETLLGLSGSSGGRFLPFDFDLVDYEGATPGADTVFLRFAFVSDSTVEDDGVYIDDLHVSCLGNSYSGDELIYGDGTSFSAPNAAGVAALLLSLAPDLSVAETRAALLAGVDRLPALAGTSVTGGRANALKAVQSVPPRAITQPVQRVSASGVDLRGVVRARAQATTYWFDYGPTLAYGRRTPVRGPGSTAGDQPVFELVTGLAPGTYHYRLTAVGPGGIHRGRDMTIRIPAQTAAVGAPVAPRITDLRVFARAVATTARARRAGRFVRFRLSEPAEITAVLARAGKAPRLLRGKSAAAGTNALALGRLARGRYSLRLMAVDRGGNLGEVARKRFRVRSRRRAATATRASAVSVPSGTGSDGYVVPDNPVNPPGVPIYNDNPFPDTGIVPHELPPGLRPNYDPPPDLPTGNPELDELVEKARHQQWVENAHFTELRGEDAAERAQELRESAKKVELMEVVVPEWAWPLGPIFEANRKAAEEAADYLDNASKLDYGDPGPAWPPKKAPSASAAAQLDALAKLRRVRPPRKPRGLRVLHTARSKAAAAKLVRADLKMRALLDAVVECHERAFAASAASRPALVAAHVEAARIYAADLAKALTRESKALKALKRALRGSARTRALGRALDLNAAARAFRQLAASMRS